LRADDAAVVHRYQLDWVELVCGGGDVIARAYPSRIGFVVERRYQRGLAAAGHSEFQMAEPTRIREHAVEAVVVHATGGAICTALAALESARTGAQPRGSKAEQDRIRTQMTPFKDST
jgi:hypothetical protein